MRIDKLLLQNFKKFASQEFNFHPQFTLLAGENGAGKHGWRSRSKTLSPERKQTPHRV